MYGVPYIHIQGPFFLPRVMWVKFRVEGLGLRVLNLGVVRVRFG